MASTLNSPLVPDNQKDHGWQWKNPELDETPSEPREENTHTVALREGEEIRMGREEGLKKEKGSPSSSLPVFWLVINSDSKKNVLPF